MAGAFLAGAAFLLPETTALNSAPARNLGVFVALICTVAPVRGLRPRRALRACASKMPKPLSATRSPLATAFFVSSMKDSTMSVTSRLVWPSFAATESIRSALFTGKTFQENRRVRNRRMSTSKNYCELTDNAIRHTVILVTPKIIWCRKAFNRWSE